MPLERPAAVPRCVPEWAGLGDSEEAMDTMSTPTNRTGRRPVRAIVCSAATLGTIAAASFFLLGETARWASSGMSERAAKFFWFAELCSQVRVPFGQALSLTIPLLLLLRMFKNAFAVTCVVLLCLASAFPAWLGGADARSRASRQASALTLISANVLRSNERMQDLFDAVLQEEPDVVGFLEFSSRWRDAAIDRLGGSHPFYVGATHAGSWTEGSLGLMLFSKLPIRSSAAPRFSIDGWDFRPFIEATLDGPHGPLTVQLVHPELPAGGTRLRQRMQQLEDIGSRSPIGERVVMGDFNTTFASPVMKRFIASTGLRDSRPGFGRLPSWNHIPLQVPGVIRRPLSAFWEPGFAIDHALVSERLKVLDRRTISLPGSDHLGVLIEVDR